MFQHEQPQKRPTPPPLPEEAMLQEISSDFLQEEHAGPPSIPAEALQKSERPPLPAEALAQSPENHKTELMSIEAVSLAKADINPEKIGPNEDAFGVYESENMVQVCDGVGDRESRHPERASAFARDHLPAHLKKARESVAMLSSEERAAAWKQIVIEGSSVITPHALTIGRTLGREEDWIVAHERTLKKTEQAFQTTEQPPAAVQTEAIAIARGMETLSRAIYETNERNATTSVGLKIMEVDGERYGIFWCVGDSEAYLEHSTPNETHVIEKITLTDNGLDVFKESGTVMNQQIERYGRFQITGQALGQAEPVITHIRVEKLQPGDQFLLASDGITDNVAVADIVPDASQMTQQAIEVYRQGKGKASVDDTTGLSGTILGKIEISDEDIRWSGLVEAVLDAESVTGPERERILAELLAHPIRKAIENAASDTAQKDGITDPDAIQRILSKRIGLRVVDLRLEPLERRIGKGEKGEIEDLAA